MDVKIYMLYEIVSGRAYLWHQPKRDDKLAKEKARKLLADLLLPEGRLFMGPIRADEMEFLGKVRA